MLMRTRVRWSVDREFAAYLENKQDYLCYHFQQENTATTTAATRVSSSGVTHCTGTPVLDQAVCS